MSTSTMTELFGSMVFDDKVMEARLPKETYKAMQKTIKDGLPLVDLEVANVVANTMKDWAIEKGATHFTHWFQPMTGITAEKHDSFISPKGDGKIIMEFSGKELVKGEPDASSFPSGGLRATFEARGYTAWDPTSYAFIKDKSLCIPTAFCSYGGEALDKKTPLLRSMEYINKEALRVLRLFGNEDVTSIKTTVGPEQEYFLVPKELYDQRKDLIYNGRTLFGAKAPKGQELDDHYFGTIKPRVAAYMADLNEELWKLGVLAKTEHNEVAPAQHELAPIFTTTNIATDHNQLTMEIMQKVAKKHGLVCLLHEKPFAGVNGSGKHNNWSISTNTGVNLLEPGETPYENAQFLLFLCAVIKGVDEYQDLLRIAVASAGNDQRLGANEAPPAVVSIFLGDELYSILEAIKDGKPYNGSLKEDMQIGVDVLPPFFKDTTDRNRTSPFAFTGNKFEFRMVGSTMSISGPNFVLNTVVGRELKQFEAEKRGLCNLKTTPDCLPYFLSDKNVTLFTESNVLTKAEMESRYEITLEGYCKVISIEACTMLDMAKKDILPAATAYAKELADTAVAKKSFLPDCQCGYEEDIVAKISALTSKLYAAVKVLEDNLAKTAGIVDITELSMYYKDAILPAMDAIREPADELETLTSKKYWPFPTYGDLLFGVR